MENVRGQEGYLDLGLHRLDDVPTSIDRGDFNYHIKGRTGGLREYKIRNKKAKYFYSIAQDPVKLKNLQLLNTIMKWDNTDKFEFHEYFD